MAYVVDGTSNDGPDISWRLYNHVDGRFSVIQILNGECRIKPLALIYLRKIIAAFLMMTGPTYVFLYFEPLNYRPFPFGWGGVKFGALVHNIK